MGEHIDMQAIAKLIRDEYEYAEKRYGLFNSMHEGESVLREEVVEVGECYNDITEKMLALFDKGVRRNDKKKALEMVADICDTAIEGICELIQVAAMAVKFEKSKDMYTESEK